MVSSKIMNFSQVTLVKTFLQHRHEYLIGEGVENRSICIFGQGFIFLKSFGTQYNIIIRVIEVLICNMIYLTGFLFYIMVLILVFN